jgi:hypothetical protein
MKWIIAYVFLLSGCFLRVQGQPPKLFRGESVLIDPKNSFIVSFDDYHDSLGRYHRTYYDTLNRLDKNGLMQGLWITYKKPLKSEYNIDSIAYLSIPFYIYEYGYCKNGKREGTWCSYYPYGEKKMEVKYFKGELVDSLTMYHENGKVKMKGKQISKSEFEIIRFDENGNLLNKRIYKRNTIKLF